MHPKTHVERALGAWRAQLGVAFLAHPVARVLKFVPCAGGGSNGKDDVM